MSEGFAPPPARITESPRWVRVRCGDETVADSRTAKLLVWYGPGMLPTYLLPDTHVALDRLTPSAGTPLVPHTEAYDVVTESATVANVAYRFTGVPPELEEAEGMWTFAWDAGLTWLEEATEVHVHARDPFKRVDAVLSERHIRVERNGQLFAESRRPTAVFETSLPTRWYFPAEEVRLDLLERATTTSQCPYKGTANYFSIPGDPAGADIAWTYPDPIPECPGIKDLVCFFNERVDLTIDGEVMQRPWTPWTDGLPG